MTPERPTTRLPSGLWLMVLCAAIAIVAVLWLRSGSSSVEEARVVPAPALDQATSPATSEVAVLAGGCFWGVQGVFQHVDGVISAVSGYAGGGNDTAQYKRVGGGATGHAESVRVTFDPRKISYGKILQIYFSVAHDPTQLDRQGPDSGPQYRSTIFPTSPQQATAAKAYIETLNQSHVFGAPIVTTIEPDKAFYPAEAYHQDYLTRHPNNPYIVYNDLPKIESLKRLFPELYRADPVLVASVVAK